MACLDRSAVDGWDCGERLASTGLPAVVDLEKPAPPGATDRANRRPHADSHDVAGEPALGRAGGSWRSAETRARRLCDHRRDIYGAHAPASVPDLAPLLA